MEQWRGGSGGLSRGVGGGVGSGGVENRAKRQLIGIVEVVVDGSRGCRLG